MKRLLLIFIVGIIANWSNPLARDMMLGHYDQLKADPRYAEVGSSLKKSYQLVKDGYAEAAAGEITVTVAGTAVDDGSGPRPAQTVATVQVPAPNDESLVVGGCSMTAEQTVTVFQEYGSPALEEPGIAEHILAECARTGIDNAVVVAQFIIESGAGSAQQWAGNMGGGQYSKNAGNIICVNNARQVGCHGRFGTYATWADGFSDKYDLLSCYADPGQDFCSGLWTGAPLDEPTVTAAMFRWAPPSDNNDSAGYARFVNGFAAEYRALNHGKDLVFPQVTEEQLVEAGIDLSDLPTYEDILATLPAEVKKPVPQGEFESVIMPIGFGPYSADCIQTNVIYGLEQSPGLQDITIQPGETFSFNENWTADVGTMVTCGYVIGASVCDWAALVLNLANKMGLETQHTDHGFKLSLVDRSESSAIWGSPGVRGGQDVFVTNNTSQAVRMQAVYDGQSLRYVGSFE